MGKGTGKAWFFAHANGVEGCGHHHRTRRAARRCLPKVRGQSRPFIVKQWRDSAGNLYEDQGTFYALAGSEGRK